MFNDKLRKKLQRTCGTCDMCCRGYLKLVIDNELFEKGKNCKHLTTIGCNIYNNRPSFCREFVCAYIADTNIPEWLKPETSKVLMLWRRVNGVLCFEVSECGQIMSNSVILWLLENYLNKTLSDIILSYNYKLYYMTNNLENFILVDEDCKKNNVDLKSAKNLDFFKHVDNLV